MKRQKSATFAKEKKNVHKHSNNKIYVKLGTIATILVNTEVLHIT